MNGDGDKGKGRETNLPQTSLSPLSWFNNTARTEQSNPTPKRPLTDSSPDRLIHKHTNSRTLSQPEASPLQSSSSVNPNERTGPRRAAQACLRCRRQKLRCLGGWPCKRCTKTKNTCDFGRPTPGVSYPSGSGKESGSGGIEANNRLEQLESSVANLLAGLAGGGVGQSNSTGNHDNDILNILNQPGRHADSFSSNDSRPMPAMSNPMHTFIPPPLHTRSIDRPRLSSTNSQLPGTSEDSSRIGTAFSASPNFPLNGMSNASPSNYTSSAFGQSPSSIQTIRPDHTTPVEISGTSHANTGEAHPHRLGKGQKAEERLAAATEDAFEPPFKALVYQPAVWDNREQSRRTSPQPSGTLSRDDSSHDPMFSSGSDRQFGFVKDKDDPVNVGLLDLPMVETLFGFFIEHCHPFLPIVNVALPFTTIRQSPPLICAMTAIAARFYIKFTSRAPSPSYSSLDPSLPSKLAHLAEAHLAQTLLRKQHALSDVQAVLLLAAWGLRSGGKGPEAWVVTGHAARIARRLGTHKVLASAAEIARNSQPGTEEWSKLETLLPQWRTWLCWFCFDGFLSLGFGRPQSTQFETVDEQGFLQLRLSQPIPRPGSTPSISLYGDVYIAGQVQLTQIGRDLINWAEVLSDPKKPEGTDADRDYSLTNMFRELNARLDDWSRLWVWNGSPYALYLGSSARITRLQAEHMRLCLNSFALKSGPDENEMIAGYLKKALNAAMSTIQTHYESSQTDLALSFATDYLTITLAQAAVFLIRINKAPLSVKKIVSLDPSVVKHYLKMSIDLLETADLSETRISTYLAKTIRDISRAAGISGIGTIIYDDPEAVDSRPHTAISYPPPIGDEQESDSAAFDLESFLQFDSQLDLGYLLGLPGDNSATTVSGTGSLGSMETFGAGFGGEFGFASGEFGEIGGGLGGFGGIGGIGGMGDGMG